MRSAMLLSTLLAACGGTTTTTVTGGLPPGTAAPGGAPNVCGAAAGEQGLAGIWRLDGASCGGEPVAMEAPEFEEEMEISVAWPAYATIAHTFVKKDGKLCRYRVDRRVEPGGSPQRVVETGRWAELAGATGYGAAAPADCPMSPEQPLDGELRLEAEALVFTMQSPSFCPGKSWVFRYRRMPCAN